MPSHSSSSVLKTLTIDLPGNASQHNIGHTVPACLYIMRKAVYMVINTHVALMWINFIHRYNGLCPVSLEIVQGKSSKMCHKLEMDWKI